MGPEAGLVALLSLYAQYSPQHMPHSFNDHTKPMESLFRVRYPFAYLIDST